MNRKEDFLDITYEVIPWDEIAGIIEPYYPEPVGPVRPALFLILYNYFRGFNRKKFLTNFIRQPLKIHIRFLTKFRMTINMSLRGTK